MVKHTMENLQQRLLIPQILFVRSSMSQRVYSIEFQNIFVTFPCANGREQGKEKKDSDGRGNKHKKQETNE